MLLPEDRESDIIMLAGKEVGQQRLELSGTFVSLLFEDQFKTMNAELQKQANISLGRWHSQNKVRKVDMSTYPDVLFSCVCFASPDDATKAVTENGIQ